MTFKGQSQDFEILKSYILQRTGFGRMLLLNVNIKQYMGSTIIFGLELP